MDKAALSALRALPTVQQTVVFDIAFKAILPYWFT